MPPKRPSSGSTEAGLLLAAALVIGALVVGWGFRNGWSAPAATAVADRVGLLTAAERRSVAAYHQRLAQDHDIDYQVLIAEAEGDIDAFAHRAFAELEVGAERASGRGLLLVIDPGADRVRLEVAAALEGVFTDALVAYLEHRQMVPFFERGRVAEGILATTELIVARAQEAAAGQAFDPTAAPSFSLGGGASTAARLNAGTDRTWAEGRPEVDVAESPEATVATFLAAMAERNARTDLAIYSEDSQAMLRSWTITPAQMDQVARTYRACRGAEVRYGDRGDRAVVRYRSNERQCAPWFLKREDARWTLDLAAAQRLVRFNHRNHWRMPERDGHAYAFGFADWRFDRHGFPLEDG